MIDDCLITTAIYAKDFKDRHTLLIDLKTPLQILRTFAEEVAEEEGSTFAIASVKVSSPEELVERLEDMQLRRGTTLFIRGTEEATRTPLDATDDWHAQQEWLDEMKEVIDLLHKRLCTAFCYDIKHDSMAIV